MKKFFTLFFAALLSVSMFADQYTVPSDVVLQDYYNNGDVCVCIYVPSDMDCNSKVLTGSFNGWSTTNCPVFEAVVGYDGWYVASFEPEAEPDEQKGMQAKPVILSNSGAFDMKYQVGAATAIRGGVQVVQGAYAGEIDLINYGADAPNVYTVDAWKNNPCTEMPSVKYYVVGDMTNWAVNADYEMTPSNEAGVEEYMYDITLTTSNQFKVVKVEGENQTWYPDGMGNNYGEHGEIKRDGDYTIYFRPALDGDEDWFYNCIFALRHLVYEKVILGALFPENGMPENGINLQGSFTDEDIAMNLVEETGAYAVFDLEAADEDVFSFVDANDPENVLVMRNAAGEWVPAVFTCSEVWEDDTWKGEPVKMIDMDLTDNSKYAWSTDIPEGLENVTMDKAQSTKVMIDGMLYIVRDGKLFNVTGAQVR